MVLKRPYPNKGFGFEDEEEYYMLDVSLYLFETDQGSNYFNGKQHSMASESENRKSNVGSNGWKSFTCTCNPFSIRPRTKSCTRGMEKSSLLWRSPRR